MGARIRFTLRLVMSLDEALTQIARAKGLTKQAVIIIAIEEYLKYFRGSSAVSANEGR